MPKRGHATATYYTSVTLTHASKWSRLDAPPRTKVRPQGRNVLRLPLSRRLPRHLVVRQRPGDAPDDRVLALFAKRKTCTICSGLPFSRRGTRPVGIRIPKKCSPRCGCDEPAAG